VDVTRRPSLEIDWRDADYLPDGHGLNICYSLDDDSSVTLAFVVGFDWRRGVSRVEVQVLREAAPAWASVGTVAGSVRLQLRQVVQEVLMGSSLMFSQGRFEVIVNG